MIYAHWPHFATKSSFQPSSSPADTKRKSQSAKPFFFIQYHRYLRYPYVFPWWQCSLFLCILCWIRLCSWLRLILSESLLFARKLPLPSSVKSQCSQNAFPHVFIRSSSCDARLRLEAFQNVVLYPLPLPDYFLSFCCLSPMICSKRLGVLYCRGLHKYLDRFRWSSSFLNPFSEVQAGGWHLGHSSRSINVCMCSTATLPTVNAHSTFAEASKANKRVILPITRRETSWLSGL